MSDRRVRERAREAALSDDPEATVRALRERLRAGEGGWIEAAARLGHEPSRRALGRFVPVITAEELPGLVEGWGEPALREALRVLARATLPGWERAFPGDPTLADAVARLEAGDAAGAVARTRAALEALERATAAVEALPAPGPAPEDEDEDALLELAERGNRRFDLLRARWNAEVAHQAALALAREPGQPPTFPSLRAEALAPHVPAIRRALAERVLRDPPGPPPEWPDTGQHAAREEARRAALEAFEQALASKAVKQGATALRRALREKRLEKGRVVAAALLGDPAAWLVHRLRAEEEAPELTPPISAEELARRLEGPVDACHVTTRQRTFQLQHDEVSGDSAWRRVTRTDERWPEWGRRYTLRLALELAERAYQRIVAAGGEDPRLEEATGAVRAMLAHPDEERGQAAHRAGLQALAAANRERGPAVRDARVIAAAASLAARAARTWSPGLESGPHPVLEAALAAGEEPAHLWEVLRAAGVDWLLEREPLPAVPARPYDPALRYEEGDAIAHPRFGPGRVRKAALKTIEVELADGTTRQLAHGRGEQA